MTSYRDEQLKSIPRGHRFWLLAISLIIILLDQLTKYLARSNLDLFQVKPVMPSFNWMLAYNRGAAFNFLATQGDWPRLFFGTIAVIVALCLVFYILNKSYSYLTGVGLSFILGGAVGNLIDRVIFGRVTDFIDWYYASYHWPTFNIADSFVTIGVTLLIIESIFFSKKTK